LIKYVCLLPPPPSVRPDASMCFPLLFRDPRVNDSECEQFSTQVFTCRRQRCVYKELGRLFLGISGASQFPLSFLFFPVGTRATGPLFFSLLVVVSARHWQPATKALSFPQRRAGSVTFFFFFLPLYTLSLETGAFSASAPSPLWPFPGACTSKLPRMIVPPLPL